MKANFMVMQAEYPALSPEFEKLKAELLSAQNKYTDLLEQYTELTAVIGKNLETEYMMKLGKKEFTLFSCHVEILRLKRIISLLNAAANRNETISEYEIKKVLEKEFSDYEKKLKEQTEKMREAEEYFGAENLSDEDIRKIKKIYHDIVRKLHPDLNPDLPPAANGLWNRVQIAYQMNSWQELLLLSDMADELLSGKICYIDTINSSDILRQELEKITQKTVKLEKEISETRKRVPYSYEEILKDPQQVQIIRKKLDDEIAVCNEYIRELQQIRRGLSERNG